MSKNQEQKEYLSEYQCYHCDEEWDDIHEIKNVPMECPECGSREVIPFSSTKIRG